MSENPQWKTNTMIAGGLLGAIIGVISAILLVRSIKENEDPQSIAPAKGMKLGMMVMNFLRQIAKV